MRLRMSPPLSASVRLTPPLSLCPVYPSVNRNNAIRSCVCPSVRRSVYHAFPFVLLRLFFQFFFLFIILVIFFLFQSYCIFFPEAFARDLRGGGFVVDPPPMRRQPIRSPITYGQTDGQPRVTNYNLYTSVNGQTDGQPRVANYIRALTDRRTDHFRSPITRMDINRQTDRQPRVANHMRTLTNRRTDTIGWPITYTNINGETDRQHRVASYTR